MPEIRNVALRPYAPSDLDAIIEVFMSSVRKVAARDYTADQLAAWAPDAIDRERWARRRENRETWVATVDDAVAGFTDLEPDGHLDMLFVDADHQGMGLAARLVAAVEASACARGLLRIFTEASLTARPFFERRGFVVLAAQEIALGDQVLCNFRMEKRLEGR